MPRYCTTGQKHIGGKKTAARNAAVFSAVTALFLFLCVAFLGTAGCEKKQPEMSREERIANFIGSGSMDYRTPPPPTMTRDYTKPGAPEIKPAPISPTATEKEKKKAAKTAKKADEKPAASPARKSGKKSDIPEVDPKAVKCPVCNYIVPGWSIDDLTPAKIGNLKSECYDRDLCPHPGTAVNPYDRIVLCQVCGYAARAGDFIRRLSPPFAKEIQKELKVKTRDVLFNVYTRLHPEPVDEKKSKKKDDPTLLDLVAPNEIPMALKYQNALTTSQLCGDTLSYRARLAREAAWAYRIEFCRLNEPLRLKELSAAILLEAGLDESATPDPRVLLEAVNHKIGKFREDADDAPEDLREVLAYQLWIMAICYDRLGELGPAHAALAKALNVTKDEALRRLMGERQKYLEAEGSYMQEALKCLKMALLRNEYDAKELPLAVYLAGEYHRRIDEKEYGKTWLLLASKLAPQKSTVAQWTQSQLELASIKDLTPQKLTDYDLRLASSIFARMDRIADASVFDEAHRMDTKCYHTMLVCLRAIEAFNKKSGRYPFTIQELRESHLLKDPETNDGKCPVTGREYSYVQPGKERRPIISDLTPHESAGLKLFCRIYHDGSIETVPAEK